MGTSYSVIKSRKTSCGLEAEAVVRVVRCFYSKPGEYLVLCRDFRQDCWWLFYNSGGSTEVQIHWWRCWACSLVRGVVLFGVVR